MICFGILVQTSAFAASGKEYPDQLIVAILHVQGATLFIYFSHQKVVSIACGS